MQCCHTLGGLQLHRECITYHENGNLLSHEFLLTKHSTRSVSLMGRSSAILFATLKLCGFKFLSLMPLMRLKMYLKFPYHSTPTAIKYQWDDCQQPISINDEELSRVLLSLLVLSLSYRCIHPYDHPIQASTCNVIYANTVICGQCNDL